MLNRHEEDVKRALKSEVQNPQSNLSKFASDFDLVQIGSMDLETGEISSHRPITIMNCQHAVMQTIGENHERIPTEQAPISKKVQ